jgi:parvulin-like peptidyl-prolyl isomerase
MLRASQKVLAEAYLTQVVRRNLDANFPSEAETRAFYDANPAAFKLPNRIHLWQIFIPAGEASTEQAKKNAKALATQLAKGIVEGKMTFAAAAAKHSKHLQSRVSDGYMGLLNTDDLLPEGRSAVDKLQPDEVSAPIASNAGFHLIKRGAAVSGKQLGYAAVQGRIVVQLQREAANRVREAALKKILETYPVTVDKAALESWLQELRSSTWPSAQRGGSIAASRETT